MTVKSFEIVKFLSQEESFFDKTFRQYQNYSKDNVRFSSLCAGETMRRCLQDTLFPSISKKALHTESREIELKWTEFLWIQSVDIPCHSNRGVERCFWVEKTFNQESNPRWNGYKGRSYMIGFFILTKHGTCCIADLTVYFNDLVWNSNFFRLQPWQFWFGLEWGNRITRWLLVKKSNRLMIRWSVLNSSGSNSNFEF